MAKSLVRFLSSDFGFSKIWILQKPIHSSFKYSRQRFLQKYLKRLTIHTRNSIWVVWKGSEVPLYYFLYDYVSFEFQVIEFLIRVSCQYHVINFRITSSLLYKEYDQKTGNLKQPNRNFLRCLDTGWIN